MCRCRVYKIRRITEVVKLIERIGEVAYIDNRITGYRVTGLQDYRITGLQFTGLQCRITVQDYRITRYRITGYRITGL
jgi:hypothetical protein